MATPFDDELNDELDEEAQKAKDPHRIYTPPPIQTEKDGYLNPWDNPSLNYITAKKFLYAELIQGRDARYIANKWKISTDKAEGWVRRFCLEVFEERFKGTEVDYDEETKIFLGQTELVLESDEGHLRNLSRGHGMGPAAAADLNADASARLTKLAGAVRKQRIQIRQEVGALPSRLFKPNPKDKEDDELPETAEELQKEIERLERREREAKKRQNKLRYVPKKREDGEEV